MSELRFQGRGSASSPCDDEDALGSMRDVVLGALAGVPFWVGLFAALLATAPAGAVPIYGVDFQPIVLRGGFTLRIALDAEPIGGGDLVHLGDLDAMQLIGLIYPTSSPQLVETSGGVNLYSGPLVMDFLLPSNLYQVGGLSLSDGSVQITHGLDGEIVMRQPVEAPRDPVGTTHHAFVGLSFTFGSHVTSGVSAPVESTSWLYSYPNQPEADFGGTGVLVNLDPFADGEWIYRPSAEVQWSASVGAWGVVPEPNTSVLVGLGLVGLATTRRSATRARRCDGSPRS